MALRSDLLETTQNSYLSKSVSQEQSSQQRRAESQKVWIPLPLNIWSIQVLAKGIYNNHKPNNDQYQIYKINNHLVTRWHINIVRYLALILHPHLHLNVHNDGHQSTDDNQRDKRELSNVHPTESMVEEDNTKE